MEFLGQQPGDWLVQQAGAAINNSLTTADRLNTISALVGAACRLGVPLNAALVIDRTKQVLIASGPAAWQRPQQGSSGGSGSGSKGDLAALAWLLDELRRRRVPVTQDRQMAKVVADALHSHIRSCSKLAAAAAEGSAANEASEAQPTAAAKGGKGGKGSSGGSKASSKASSSGGGGGGSGSARVSSGQQLDARSVATLLSWLMGASRARLEPGWFKQVLQDAAAVAHTCRDPGGWSCSNHGPNDLCAC